MSSISISAKNVSTQGNLAPELDGYLVDMRSLEHRMETVGQRELTSPRGLDQEALAETTLQLQTEALNVNSLVARLQQRITQPTSNRRVATLSPIAEWEGYVEKIAGDSFFVKLQNLSDGSSLPEDEAEFELRDLPRDDQRALEVGAIVRWVVGLERLANDVRQKVSRLHVRRLPAHSKKEIREALDEARAFNASVNWDE